MTITYHNDLEQGSDEWLAARCGLLTASNIKLILTPILKIASNDKERSHLYELLAQRITKYVEPQYISDDMLRGQVDEIKAIEKYSEKYAPVEKVGFVTNDEWGFTLGYSPDGLVGEDGLVEAKSRRQKYQIESITEYAAKKIIPEEYMLQSQAGLLVTKRQWLDFISYCGGLPMIVVRVYPDPKIQAAILDAAAGFEKRMAEKRLAYDEYLLSDNRWIETERETQGEIVL